jgi:hypothetical protein
MVPNLLWEKKNTILCFRTAFYYSGKTEMEKSLYWSKGMGFSGIRGKAGISKCRKIGPG